eukprot:scaffold111223_cov63-Phaeocystis_antarctica.AAC.1
MASPFCKAKVASAAQPFHETSRPIASLLEAAGADGWVPVADSLRTKVEWGANGRSTSSFLDS